MNYLEKYGYAPDVEAMGRALEHLASTRDEISSEQVYKDCFSMMDLTTLKSDDTPSSVTKFVGKVNSFKEAYPQWPLPASVCVYSNFAKTVAQVRKQDFNITVVSACFPSSQSFLEVKLRECEMAVEQGAFKVLLKELQSLALDVKVLTESGDELIIREVEEDEDNADNTARNKEISKDEELEEIDFNVDDDEDEEDDFDVKSIFETDDDDEDGFNITEADEDDDFDDDDETLGFGKLFEEDDFDDEE